MGHSPEEVETRKAWFEFGTTHASIMNDAREAPNASMRACGIK
jgi:hypothetical protein